LNVKNSANSITNIFKIYRIIIVSKIKNKLEKEFIFYILFFRFGITSPLKINVVKYMELSI